MLLELFFSPNRVLNIHLTEAGLTGCYSYTMLRLPKRLIQLNFTEASPTDNRKIVFSYYSLPDRVLQLYLTEIRQIFARFPCFFPMRKK